MKLTVSSFAASQKKIITEIIIRVLAKTFGYAIIFNKLHINRKEKRVEQYLVFSVTPDHNPYPKNNNKKIRFTSELECVPGTTAKNENLGSLLIIVDTQVGKPNRSIVTSITPEGVFVRQNGVIPCGIETPMA